MPRVYRSSVKETTRKAPLESPHPHPPYQAHTAAEEEAAHTVAAEEAAHTAAVEEAAQADTLVETEPDTLGDIHIPHDVDTSAEIQADTPAPDTVSSPSFGIDPSVTMRPQHHQL